MEQGLAHSTEAEKQATEKVAELTHQVADKDTNLQSLTQQFEALQKQHTVSMTLSVEHFSYY